MYIVLTLKYRSIYIANINYLYAYIQKLLEGDKVIITKIAQGIPHGVDIEYIDSLTLERAIEERKTI